MCGLFFCIWKFKPNSNFSFGQYLNEVNSETFFHTDEMKLPISNFATSHGKATKMGLFLACREMTRMNDYSVNLLSVIRLLMWNIAILKLVEFFLVTKRDLKVSFHSVGWKEFLVACFSWVVPVIYGESRAQGDTFLAP